MQDNFKVVSLSYRTAPLEIRELFALSEQDVALLLKQLREVLDLQEGMIISTCNRTELYYTAPIDLGSEVVSLLCAFKGMQAKDYHAYFLHLSEREALVHLYRVAMGLESQVVGDLQISHQVKRAYQASADLGMAGPFLHRLLHTIFYTNKRVVQETAFRDGAASVSYAAVELVEELTQNILNPRVLVVGLGEIGLDVVKNLKDSSLEHVMLCNRTASKAERLAEECGFEAVPFEHVWRYAKEADVIISSLAMPAPFFTAEHVKGLDILAFKCFIDLSVPRSVAEEVERIPGVVAYNVDEINNRTVQTVERRKQSIPHVERIIEESLQEFSEWANEMVISPAIQKLKNALEQIRQDEINRFVKQLDEQELEKVDKITRSIMNKIIRIPVLQLKAACKRDEADTLVDVLTDLFNLEPDRVAKQ